MQLYGRGFESLERHMTSSLSLSGIRFEEKKYLILATPSVGQTKRRIKREVWGKNLWLSKTLQKWLPIFKVNNATSVWIVRIEEAKVRLEILTRPRHTRTENHASKGGVRRETCPEQPHKHEQESAKKYIKYKQAAVFRFYQNFEKNIILVWEFFVQDESQSITADVISRSEQVDLQFLFRAGLASWSGSIFSSCFTIEDEQMYRRWLAHCKYAILTKKVLSMCCFHEDYA